MRYAESFDEAIADIGTLTLDDVRAFHRDFYGARRPSSRPWATSTPPALRPSCASLSATGPAWPLTPRAAAATCGGAGAVPARDARQGERVLRRAARLPAARRTASTRRCAWASQIFGGSGGGTGWLWDRIREKDGLSYGVGATVSGGAFNANATWSVYAISANQNADRVKAALEQELVRARRDGFTADELKRAKDSLIASSRLARAQDGALAGALVSFVERGKTPKYMAELDDLRAQITLDEVNAAFRKYIVPEQIVYAVAGDLAGAKAAAGGAPDVVPPVVK